MENKEQEREFSSAEFEQGKSQNDYKFLVQKLKSVKEIITLLEKNLLDKEI